MACDTLANDDCGIRAWDAEPGEVPGGVTNCPVVPVCRSLLDVVEEDVRLANEEVFDSEE